MNDQFYIKRCIELALKAKGKTSPNPLVGCVIVKNGRIIAEGWHKKAGSAHAEVVALKNAGAKAKGAVLYVNLEPCFHVGRTPPCVSAVINAGIKRVVIGIKDPNPLTNGRSILLLQKNKIKVTVGVLSEECARLNEIFLKVIKTGLPFVVAKSAQSLDGKIATKTGHSKWITSDKTRAFARRLRNEFDAILVGVNTILKDNPGLNASKKNTIKKIVLDSVLRTPINSKIFSEVNSENCILATTQKANRNRIAEFQEKGICVIVCPHKGGRVDLRWLFKELANRQITSILVEGGSQTIADTLKNNLVDKMHIYIAPKIIGGEKSLSAIGEVGIVDINKSIKLKRTTFQKIDQDIYITGYVYRNR